MTLVSNVPQRDIPQSYQPQTGFTLTQGTTGTQGTNATQGAGTAQGTGTAQESNAASRTAQTPLVMAQATGSSQTSQAPVSPGSYTFYLERGDARFPVGTPNAGQEVGPMARENAQRLQTALAPRMEAVDSTLQRVQADPSFAPAVRDTIESGLRGSQRDLRQAQEKLQRATERYNQEPTSAEARRELSQASQQAYSVLNRSEVAVQAGQRELTANARYRANQTQQQAAREARGEAVSSTLSQATNAATASGDPGRTLAAADQILSLRSSDTSRLSNDSLAGGVDNRRVSWDTGSTPLATVAGQVQTLHGQNAAGRESRIQQLETRAQELERQSPGSLRTPGSQAWEMANLATTLKAAGQQSDAANETLGKTRAATANGVPHHTVNPLEFQTSRAAEAVAFEARVQRDADQALSGPADSTATNLSQAQARVATMADTMAQPGATDLHGRATVETQAQTMRDVFKGRQNELRELDRRLEAEQRSATGPAPGEAGSRAGEIQVLRTAIGQEMQRLDKAGSEVTDRFTDGYQSWQRQTGNIAQESEGRSLRHSDGLMRHAEAVLAGGTGVGNAAVMGAVAEQRSGEILDPNASAVWLQGRATQAQLATGREQVADLPALAAQMPADAFGGGGRFQMTNVEGTMTSSAASLANLDKRLDRLETGRAGDGQMLEAERALTDAQGQVRAVGNLNQARQTIATQLEERATIAQTNPGLAAMRSDTLQRANTLAGGAPEPAQGNWQDYLTIQGGSSVGGSAMRGDLENLNTYTADADRFISQRQTELNDRLQRGGDPDGRIGKELQGLDAARVQISEAQASLKTANAQIGGNDAKAGEEMFSAAMNLRVATSFLRDSVSSVRSEPR
ncbi:hypothetical protein [Salinarimonas soli]|uniref:Uncharacterized protein n=1 Tax=Salinarimonas soli TaxID=1638099 RepID=A0A5B2VEE3_9HYPH|nr:hypothetical protein [Salinarimonas soli]KAA2237461.1 hypothetical protein F0L46_10730 [Salinarimonas soli]